MDPASSAAGGIIAQGEISASEEGSEWNEGDERSGRVWVVATQKNALLRYRERDRGSLGFLVVGLSIRG